MTAMLSGDVAADRFSLLVTVGSDHHAFDRLIGWVDRWLTEQDRRAVPVRAVLQYGTARPPSYGDARPFLPHDELLSCMQESSVVVMQGGPMGILEARSQGHVPVVVPRLRALNEVVDDHQRAFCEALRSSGDLHLAQNEAELCALLDLALTTPEAFRAPPRDSALEVSRSVAAFAGIANDLIGRKGRGRRRFAPATERARVIDLRGPVARDSGPRDHPREGSDVTRDAPV